MRQRSTRLCELTTNIWIAERPQRFYGLEVGTRMTVIRLADGSLLLHSPVALDPELRRELDSIGRVCFAVAPNRVHHLHAGEVTQAYPEARLWVAPGLERAEGFARKACTQRASFDTAPEETGPQGERLNNMPEILTQPLALSSRLFLAAHRRARVRWACSEGPGLGTAQSTG